MGRGRGMQTLEESEAGSDQALPLNKVMEAVAGVLTEAVDWKLPEAVSGLLGPSSTHPSPHQVPLLLHCSVLG